MSAAAGTLTGMDKQIRYEIRHNVGPLLGYDRARAAIDAHYRWLDQLVIDALRARPPATERPPDADKA